MGSGFDIGGKFANHKKTTWRIVGKFRKINLRLRSFKLLKAEENI